VHDAERMRLGHRLDRLQHVVDAFPGGERPPLAQLGGEIPAVEVLHHHVRGVAFPVAYVEHADDVLALDARGGAGLAPEPLGRLAALDELGHEELQRDPLVELEMPRGDDHAHAASPDDSLDPVFAGDDVVLAGQVEHRNLLIIAENCDAGALNGAKWPDWPRHTSWSARPTVLDAALGSAPGGDGGRHAAPDLSARILSRRCGHEARSHWRAEGQPPGGARRALRSRADGENTMETTKYKVCYAITERNDKTYWNRIGVAFINKDGSLNVKLDAFPIGGTLQIRDNEPREEFDANGAMRPRPIRAAGGARPAPDQSL
jgi:hypothetical protein